MPWSVQAAIISVSIAQVGDHILTSREVRLHALVTEYLNHNHFKKSSKEKSLKSQAFATDVNEAIFDWMAYQEAQDLVSTSSKAQLQNEKKILRALRKLSLWKKYGFKKKEVESLLKRKRKAAEFIRLKVELFLVQAKEQKLERSLESWVESLKKKYKVQVFFANRFLSI